MPATFCAIGFSALRSAGPSLARDVACSVKYVEPFSTKRDVTPAPPALTVPEYAASPMPDSVWIPGICLTALSKSVRETGARVIAKVSRPSPDVKAQPVTFMLVAVPGIAVVCDCWFVTGPMTVSTSLRASVQASWRRPVAAGLGPAAVAVAVPGAVGVGAVVVAAGAHAATNTAMTMRDAMKRDISTPPYWVAVGLVAYGAIGLLLVAAALAGGWSGIAKIDAAMGSVAQAGTTLDAVADAFGSFDTSLETAARSAEDAAAAGRDAAATAGRLADAMSLSIFGAQPLLPLSNDFRRQSTELGVVATDLEELSRALAKDRNGIAGIQVQVSALAERVSAIGATPGSGGVATLLVALLGWVGVQAAAALVVGIALLRRRPHRRA